MNQYIVSERNKALNDLADDEQISADVLNLYIKEYDYLQKEQPEIIQKALKEKHLGLIKTRKAHHFLMADSWSRHLATISCAKRQHFV